MDPKRKKIILAVLGALSLLLFSFLGWKAGKPLLAFAGDPEAFRAWIDERGAWGPVTMVGMVVFQVIFALIPGEPFEIAAGYAFGGFYGCLLCLVGTTIGGTVVFFLVHKWGTRVLELYFSREKIESLAFLRDTPKTRTLAFLLMMLPGTPKDLLSYGMGLTKITLPEWMFISLIARIPSVLTSTVAGSAIGEKRYVFAALVFGVTTAAGLFGLWIYRRMSASKEKK